MEGFRATPRVFLPVFMRISTAIKLIHVHVVLFHITIIMIETLIK